MELKYRKLVYRLKPIHLLMRWVMYNKGFFYYKKLYKERNYSEIFTQLHNSKRGQRCFIIGNGPSLRVEDLDRLIGEDCFGANEIHRIFSKTRWRPKYYMIADRYSKSTPEEIKDLECDFLFLSDYYCRYNSVIRKDAICLRGRYFYNDSTYRFSDDISKYVVIAPTVSYWSMQIAAYLGYSEIYLLGFDHSYSFEFDKYGKVVSTGVENTHFFNDDNAKDIIGNVWGMTKAYEAFMKYADEHNINVKNATRGGKLEIFKRIDFDSLVGK